MEFNLIFKILLTNSIILLMLGLFLYRRRHESRSFAWLMFAAALWAIAGAFEASIDSESWRIIFSQISYLGIVSIGPLWLFFAWEYTENPIRKDKRIYYLWLIPALILILVLTNGWHGLIWPYFTRLDINGSWRLIYGRGLGFYLNIIYSYILLATGIFVFLKSWQKATRIRRAQLSLVLLGTTIPWIANALYTLFFPEILFGIDITPLALITTGILVVISILKYKFLSFLPAAKDLISNSLDIGIIIINQDNILIDFNPAAEKIIPSGLIVGRSLQRVHLGKGKSLLALIDATNLQDVILDKQAIELSFSSLNDREGRKIGRIILLSDITNRRHMENELKRSRSFFKNITDFLPDPTFAIDKDGKVVVWNKAMEKLTGKSSKDVLGKKDFAHSRAFYGRKRPMLVDLLIKNDYFDQHWRQYKDHELYREEETLATKIFIKEKGRWFFVIASPLKDEKGEITHAVESVRDITELEQHNEKIQEKITELSRLNAMMVHRELKMRELKNEVKKLQAVLKKAGLALPPPEEEF